MWKQTLHDVLDSIGIIQAGGLSSLHQSLGNNFELSFSTSPIKSFQHWSLLFFMPCLRADFAILHASRSRESPFERMNLRRAARHSRRRTGNWSSHQYIEAPERLCPQRGIEGSHVAISFRLTARTVSSNNPADLAQSSSSMSLVS